MHFEYIEAGFKVFGLHGVTNGVCDCGNENCKALFKHPRTSAWQHTPNWSDEQLDFMEKQGHFNTGFGVLVDGFLVVDIDPRNGGSLESLPQEWKESGFIVATGGGGWHIYFKNPSKNALKQHLDEYPGVDFKSSGYVVGCGSIHASGTLYETESGSPDEITEAPESLLAALKKEHKHRGDVSGVPVDISDDELREILSFISPSCDYDTWIKVGMGIHETTSGEGIDIWDSWSSKGDSYDGELDHHWHSFGKCANPVTLGTLIHFAEQTGYVQSVTFETEIESQPLSDDGVDLLRPPGFVGEVAQWINNQCRFPRERLAVAAAISAVSNVSGMRHVCSEFGAMANQFIFCVAGSATGKEAVQQAQLELHRAAGIAPATHGTIKSEQEIIRNLLDHQGSFYVVDEIGILLGKISNASKRGGASYLEGVFGALMSAYSKSNGYFLLSGDLKKELKEKLGKQLSQARKKIDENEDKNGHFQRLYDRLSVLIPSIDNGLKHPFQTLIGFTTPVTFEGLVDYEQATNGFIGRSLLVRELETNPTIKRGFKPEPMPEKIRNMMMTLYAGGHTKDPDYVSGDGDLISIPTDDDGMRLLEEVQQYFYDQAEDSKVKGLEAIPRRAFELVLKLSLTLGIPGGIRTAEHVRWAFSWVKADVNEKINLAASNMAESLNIKDEALIRKIFGMLSADSWVKSGQITNRCRPTKKEDVQKALDKMIKNQLIESRQTDSRRPGTEYRKIGELD